MNNPFKVQEIYSYLFCALILLKKIYKASSNQGFSEVGKGDSSAQNSCNASMTPPLYKL